MAEFSKQYCDLNPDEGFDPDFDIMEEFDKLEPSHYLPIICEGFGFIAIGNFKGECKLAFRKEDWSDRWENFEWRDYKEVIK